MDSNDVIENLWYEAETIRRAVAEAYEAVAGPTPLPSSLTQILAFIAANAGGGGGGCGATSTCVPNEDIDALWDAMVGDSQQPDPMPPRDELVGMIALLAADSIVPALTQAVENTISNTPRLDVSQLTGQLESGTSIVRSTAGTLAARMNVEAPKLNANDSLTDARDGLDVFDADMEAFFSAVGNQSEPFAWDHITADAGKNVMQQTYSSDPALLVGLREGGTVTFAQSSDSVGEILNTAFGGE